MIGKKIKSAGTFILVSSLLLCGMIVASQYIFRQNAYAERATANEILEKIMMSGMVGKCSFSPYLKAELDINEYTGSIESLLGSDGYTYDRVWLPTNVGNTLKSYDGVSCKELLLGYDGVYGKTPSLIKMAGISVPAQTASQSQIDAFLKNMGYIPAENTATAASSRCFWLDYGIVNGAVRNESPKLCFHVNSEGKVLPGEIRNINAANQYINISLVPSDDGYWKFKIQVANEHDGWNTYEVGSFYNDEREGVSWEDMLEQFSNSLSFVGQDQSLPKEKIYINNNGDRRYHESSEGEASYNPKYVLSDDSGAKIARFFGNTGYKDFSEYAFSYRQVYGLYTIYLEDFFDLRIDKGDCASALSELESSYGIMVNADGEKKWCGVRGDIDGATGTVRGFEGQFVYLNAHLTAKDLLEYLRDGINYDQINVDDLIKISEIDESGKITTPTDPTDDGGSAVGDDDFCMSANSGAMGWGICPAITGLRGILAGVYGRFIVPMLEIDTSFLSTDGATYDGWTTFRNIANIFFVILILAVIFSQVTGYGIDNYGIKRILPKLIVTAILVNFSFIICQLAVDISNILGSGLKSLFYGMATSESISIGEASVSIGPDTSAFVASMNGLFEFLKYATLIGGGIALFMSPGSVAMAILVAFLGVAAAVLFMFASLGARTVGVIVLTVISPLAFVAYALPNTNSLFRQWWNIFKGLLLLYPICGLLVGGGQFVGTLIFHAAGSQSDPATAFFYILIALLTSVLPFFALPTLLKRTMTAMGGIGTAITNAGARVRGATRRVGTSEWAKEARIRGNAGIAGGLRSRAIGKFGTKGMKRRMSGQLAARDELDKRNRLSARMLQDNYDTRSASQIASDLSLDMNEQDLSVSLDRLSSMDMKQATDWVAAQAAKLDIENNEGDYRRLQNLSRAVKNNDRLHQAMSKEEDVKRMLDNNGYIGRDRKNLLGSGGHAATFAKSANTGDYLGLSSGAQRRAISTGGLSSATKNELMNSSDPAIRSAIAGDQGKADNLDALRAGAAISDFDNTDGQASQRISEIAAQYRNTQSVNEAYAENDARNAQARQASAAEAAQDRQAQRIAEEIGNVINVPRSQSAEDAARSFGEQQQEWWDRNNNS